MFKCIYNTTIKNKNYIKRFPIEFLNVPIEYYTPNVHASKIFHSKA